MQAIPFIWQTAAAFAVGVWLGISIGFAIGAWWHALRTESRAQAEADLQALTRAYRGPDPIKTHRTLAAADQDEQA